MSEKTIKVDYVKVKKEGTKDGNAWKLYNLKDSEGNWYDSFDEFQKGETVLVDITPNGDYNPNIKRAGLSRQPAEVLSTTEHLDTSDSILFQVCLKIAGEICKEKTEEAIVNQAKELARLSKGAIRELKKS